VAARAPENRPTVTADARDARPSGDDDPARAPARAELAARLARLGEARPEDALADAVPESAAAAVAATAARVARGVALGRLIGDEPRFRRLVDGLSRVAASEGTVLVTGETGTGKELYARAVHQLGPRRDHPFIAVDCGAFPEQLFESELYGHARGAFTDARSEQRGLARMADGGVLFLDEIDSLSLPAQGKLLRFLQERTFKPLGADRFYDVDIRVVGASNRDLGRLVESRQFRADLYFRLNVLPVHIMPLRERRGDVSLLARHFLELHARAPGVGPRRFAAGALAALAAYDFPGNVRELSNLVQRAVVMATGPEIRAEDLRALLPAASAPEPAADAAARPSPGSFREAKTRAIAAFERAFVSDLLRRHAGNITRASREAHKDRRAFGRLVKKYGLDRSA